MNDGLTETHWKSVHKALADIPGIERAQLFGSRAMGTFSPTSDVDLALYGDSLTLQQELKLTAVLNEIDPLLEFDVLRFKTITSKALIEHIEKYGVVVYEGGRDKNRINSRQGRKEECNWKYYKLDECADFFSGGTPSKANSSYWKGGIPWVSAKDMKTFRLYEAEDHITQEAADNGTRMVPPDSILLLVRGMTLHNDIPVCYTKRDMAFNQDIKALRAKDSVEPLFLAYWLLAYKSKLLNIVEFAGHGTGRLPTDILKNLDIYLPPLPEQRAIAHILGTLDDKIELNRKMNETFEAMGLAIFKSWFVDFDPVRDKIEGRIPAGMDAETAALFPDGFEDSELGEIPRGWRVGKLEDIGKVNARTINKDYSHIEIEYIDISSVSVGKLLGTSRYYFKDAPSRARRLVNHGDTIWSMVRPNRKSYLYMHEPKDNTVVSTGFAVLSPKNESPSYLYAWVTTENFVDYLTNNADGSAYPAVLPTVFEDALIIQPEERVLVIFEKSAGVLRGKIAGNEKESRTLAQLRDTLLPKLLSGELRVKDVEKFIGARI